MTSNVSHPIRHRGLRALSDTRICDIGDNASCRIKSERALTSNSHDIVRITRGCVWCVQTRHTSTRRDKTRSCRKTRTTGDVRETDCPTRQHGFGLRRGCRRRGLRHNQRDLRRGLLPQGISNDVLNRFRHRSGEVGIRIKRHHASRRIHPVFAVCGNQRAALRRNQRTIR